MHVINHSMFEPVHLFHHQLRWMESFRIQTHGGRVIRITYDHRAESMVVHVILQRKHPSIIQLVAIQAFPYPSFTRGHSIIQLAAIQAFPYPSFTRGHSIIQLAAIQAFPYPSFTRGHSIIQLAAIQAFPYPSFTRGHSIIQLAAIQAFPTRHSP